MADAAAAQLQQLLYDRINQGMLVLFQQHDYLANRVRQLLQACEQPSAAQMAAHRAHEQGEARAVRLVLAHLANSLPHLELAAELLASALKDALHSGAARDALPVLPLPHGHEDQTADALLALPRASDLQLVPVSVQIAHACVRLAIDHIRRCAFVLRRIGLLLHQPHQLAIHQARGYLARACDLMAAARGHTFDAVFADMA